MTKPWAIPAVFAIMSASPLVAASPFDGTWKGDIPSAQLSQKPRVELLKDGVWSCSTCVPELTVPADGKFHAIIDSPYADSMSVTVVDPLTIKTVSKLNGKVVNESIDVVAADDKTATFTFTETAPNGLVTNGKGTTLRVKAGPAGSHAISGE